MDFLKLLAEERRNILKVKDVTAPTAQDLATSLFCVTPSNNNVCNEQNYRVHINQCYNSSVFCMSNFRFSFEGVDEIFYFPDFIDHEVEAKLISTLDYIDWKVLTSRKSKVFGNVIKSSNMKAEDGYVRSSIPYWLESFIDELVRLHIFPECLRPDSILVNKYNPTEGILHHTDGPSYYDRVAILSLRSDCVMSFRHKVLTEEIGGDVYTGDIFSVILQSCSLLVFTGDVYSKHMHGIAAEPTMRQSSKDYGVCLNAPSADTTVENTHFFIH